MKIVPAIDLMNGQVVRLQQGNADAPTYYTQWGSPVHVAKKWTEEGAPAIHIIDLDAAFGRRSNRDVVEKIQKEVDIPIQFGGGLRTITTITEILRQGIQRVILGTLAFERTSDLTHLLHQFGSERFVVALDYINTRVMIRGWRKATQYNIDDALNMFLNIGIDTFLFTSISNDGLLTGPDYMLLNRIVKTSPRATVVAAGGIGSLHDISKLKTAGVHGVVIGKALYENKIRLKDAIKIASI